MSSSRQPYKHQRYELQRSILKWLLRRVGWRVFARFAGAEGVENVPAAGPAILMINHIAFVDPLAVMACLPRNIVPLAKSEVFWIPLWGIFPWIWRVIPVRRQELDRRALQQALEILAAGEIVLVAPDGTRRPALTQGKEGVAYLAYKSGAPIVPVAVEGTRGYPRFPPGKGPGARVKFGRPFRLKTLNGRLTRELLRQSTDEALYVLAAMLPEHRRGYYSDLSKATRDFVDTEYAFRNT